MVIQCNTHDNLYRILSKSHKNHKVKKFSFTMKIMSFLEVQMKLGEMQMFISIW